MSKQTIDGKAYAQMLLGGSIVLSAHAREVDDLNVFPIPDGDTGENMLLTIRGGADGHPQSENLAQESKRISENMLLSARGNSGVILSQFFEGITRGFENVPEADAEALGEAFRCGVACAYKAVLKPTEGTILTVIRESTEYACAADTDTPQDFLEAFIEEAKRSLERTPELLPVLKKAGVVDSGAAGLIYIMEGMKRALAGEAFEVSSAQEAADAQEPDLDAFGADSILELGYCTELLLRLQNAKTCVETFDTLRITEYLETIGDSIVAVKNGSIVKIHVHTMTPHLVLAFCQQYGEFLKVKIENMSLQHNHIAKESEKAQASPAPAREKKPFGVVAVANGEGIKEAFLGMGADVIVDGGQSMNPATEDFLQAFDQTCAHTILVFPNNGNIILAAKQAASLYSDAQVHVLPSKTIGEGYAALSMLDTDSGNVDSILEDCEMAMEGVLTAEVSQCVRDADMDGVSAHTGDYIGFMGKELLASAPDRKGAAMLTLDRLDLEEHAVCILICGEDSTDEEARELHDYIHARYPMTEVYMINGGQNVYSYIIVAE